VLEIEDADKAIAELDPDDKFEELVKEGMFKKPRKKIVALNWTGLSSLLFRSQTPFAKKFQRFVNNYIFFDMFLHCTPYFEEHWDWDENCMEEYGSVLKDLEVNLGVWAD
jgi:prophage antirepressor-like protein